MTNPRKKCWSRPHIGWIAGVWQTLPAPKLLAMAPTSMATQTQKVSDEANAETALYP